MWSSCNVCNQLLMGSLACHTLYQLLRERRGLVTLVHVFWHCTRYFWKSHSPIRCILSHDVTSGTPTRTGPAHILIPHAFLFMAAKNLSLLAVVKKAANLLGYENLRSSQEEAICRFLEGKDIFISLPTGSGKSLCYFVLPMIFNELRNCSSPIAIVVSPLTALMKEQVQKLLQEGSQLFMLETCPVIATVVFTMGTTTLYS